MNSSYLISIIVPVYNVEKYLRKCLDSIINQTYQNIEIILVDDGSEDASGQICDEYAGKDARIRVIHKENGGLSSARNAGLNIAKGDYVMFVDSDDYVEPQFCEIPLKLALENEVDIVSFGYNRVYEEVGKQELKKTKHPRMITASEGIKELITKKDIIYNLSCNKIYKRFLFEDVRFPFGKYYEDNAVVYLLFHKASKLYVSDYLLYNYLYRETSISADWDKPKSIIDRFSIWLERLSFIREYYPEIEIIQINQLVDEAIKGFLRLTGKLKYRKSVSMFSHFMDENKKDILSLRDDKILKIYYWNKILFYSYCIYYRCRFMK